MPGARELIGSDPALRGLVDGFFRRESGQLVAALVRVFGLSRIDLAEDVVQYALVRALETWRLGAVPDDPRAWVYRVARNRALDVLRRQRTASEKAPFLGPPSAPLEGTIDHIFLEGEVADGQLRMIFTCCHPDLPAESRIALTLKTLCGFSTAEIARALLIELENAKRRISRAKAQFATGRIAYEVPAGSALGPRLASVHGVLYALFNEGYSASGLEGPIRPELCAEAHRLALALSGHAVAAPATHALVALMALQRARLPARTDGDGGIVLLPHQQRDRWDEDLIAAGVRALARSAEGAAPSRYHLEAGIAAKHCLAPDFDATDWSGLLDLYDKLLAIHPSPVAALNRAIIVGRVHGPQAALDAIERSAGVESLRGRYHLVEASRGAFLQELGRDDEAREAFLAASNLTSSPAERVLLEHRIRACSHSARPSVPSA